MQGPMEQVYRYKNRPAADCSGPYDAERYLFLSTLFVEICDAQGNQ